MPCSLHPKASAPLKGCSTFGEDPQALGQLRNLHIAWARGAWIDPVEVLTTRLGRGSKIEHPGRDSPQQPAKIPRIDQDGM